MYLRVPPFMMVGVGAAVVVAGAVVAGAEVAGGAAVVVGVVVFPQAGSTSIRINRIARGIYSFFIFAPFIISLSGDCFPILLPILIKYGSLAIIKIIESLALLGAPP